MPRIFQDDGKWGVMSDCGEIVVSGLSNAQAWREIDRINGDAQSARDFKKDFVDAVNDAETKEQWYSALLKIAHDRGRKRGWAAYVFKDKFGHFPDGLPDDFGPTFPAVNLFLKDNRGRNK